jgi:hypothetical protein
MTVSGEISRGAMRSICSWKARLALAPKRARRRLARRLADGAIPFTRTRSKTVLGLG